MALIALAVVSLILVAAGIFPWWALLLTNLFIWAGSIVYDIRNYGGPWYLGRYGQKVDLDEDPRYSDGRTSRLIANAGPDRPPPSEKHAYHRD